MKITFLLLGGAILHVADALPRNVIHAGHGYSMSDEQDIEERDSIGECVVPAKHHTTTTHTQAHTTTHASVKPTSTTAKAPKSTTGKATSTKNPFTVNGIKAGLSGYPGINLYSTEAMDSLAPYMGWYSDYTASTPDYGKLQGIPMLWGDGNTCVSSTDVKKRVADFYNVTSHSTPKIMFGFYEPDCDCPMSSDMSNPVYGAQRWNQMLAPLAKRGTILGSPSLCKQADDDWLTPFKKAGLNADWEVTSIHINVFNLAGVQRDVEHYAKTYGKPIWVSELACVHAGPGFFNPCTDQNEIDHFLNTVIPWLEANETIVAYGASNGEGLGDVWPLTKNGALTHTGNTYLNALKNLHL